MSNKKEGCEDNLYCSFKKIFDERKMLIVERDVKNKRRKIRIIEKARSEVNCRETFETSISRERERRSDRFIAQLETRDERIPAVFIDVNARQKRHVGKR